MAVSKTNHNRRLRGKHAANDARSASPRRSVEAAGTRSAGGEKDHTVDAVELVASASPEVT